MQPDLSRRLGKALGTHMVTPQERESIIAAAERVDAWDDLPTNIRALVTNIERRPPLWA